MSEITCTRCGRTGEPLSRAPLRNELGERILASICRTCWDQWLRFQTALINHNGLDVRDKPAREFLTANMEAFLFKEGQAEQIDTSQQGKINW
jgi:Fe-S cluster biosynthesis and repair protein YggX